MTHPSQGILLIRLKSMGDILFTLPSVHALRAQSPQARIVFLVSKEYSPLLQGFEDLSTCIELDRAQFRGLHPFKIAAEATKLFRQMRRERLRLAIDFQGYGETALLTWASGAPQRWGTVYRPGRKWAYTCSVNRNPNLHPAEDYLALLKQNGLPCPPVKNEFALPQRAVKEASEFLQSNGLSPGRPILFIQPLTSAAQKNWPLERYLEVARHWSGQGWQILFGGGPGDRAALEPVQTAGFLSSAGASLLLSAGLAYHSALVLGGDTGLVHLAVAMGKRVAMLMRSIRPGSTHPFQHADWAIGPKAEGLIDSITVEAVNRHLAQAFAQMGPLPPPLDSSQPTRSK